MPRTRHLPILWTWNPLSVVAEVRFTQAERRVSNGCVTSWVAKPCRGQEAPQCALPIAQHRTPCLSTHARAGRPLSIGHICVSFVRVHRRLMSESATAPDRLLDELQRGGSLIAH